MASDAATPRDARRWIYGGLDLLFAVAYTVAIVTTLPNRWPSATVHLWSIPVATAVMGAGTLAGGRTGWRVAIGGGSVVLAATCLLIARIVAGTAQLAAIYGGFGQAAVTFVVVVVALVVELVALLPIVQLRFLRTRAGRRAFGVA